MFLSVTTVLIAVFASTILPTASSAQLATVYTGDGTFFEPGLGACGNWNTEQDAIVAVGHGVFDSYPGATPNPNLNPICGKQIKATYGGKSVVVTVEDRCGDCPGAADLDFSPSVFARLADLDVGRLHGVKWVFL
ncbi:barwin-like endoglucanase [Mycena filopes]|nr:barwin-like endoglucanase [Mycena filopes]